MNTMTNEGDIGTRKPNSRYDVFLSFWGPLEFAYTRCSFPGNLYNALRHKRIKTFIHAYEVLKFEHPPSPSAFKALEESRISIVVLCQNYVSCFMCLDELVRILACMKSKGQLVLPIFYDVDPSLGNFYAGVPDGFPFSNYKSKEWCSALSQVPTSKGFYFKSGCQYEYELIQTIVERVIKNLPRYNVFLSFSEDTRYSFSGFLYNVLRRERFKTFVNDERLEDGDPISLSFINAIEKARVTIIIFSQNYAYSWSCLDQLVTILDCMKTKNQLVWPIFYKVEPSDLRHQINNYGKAMEAHEKTFGKDSKKVQEWRSALSQVANLKGWHFITGYEYEFIEKFVERAIRIYTGL